MRSLITTLLLLSISCSSFALSFDTPTSTNMGLVASIEKRLVTFVHQTVETLNYSVYKLGGSQFDPSRGVYVVDCSNYVDHILQEVSPNAYWRNFLQNMVNVIGAISDINTT